MTGLEKLLRWHSMRGGISTQDATATGNPATFETTLVRPLVKCEAAFVPIQPGTGNPSPSNERPITGFDGITVNLSGADTSNPTEFSVSWQSVAGTVYGGKIDLVTGILSAEWYGIQCTPEGLPDLRYDSTTSDIATFYFYTSANGYPPWQMGTIISNNFVRWTSDTTPWIMKEYNWNGGWVYLKIATSQLESTNLAGARKWFEQHPTIIVAKAQEPLSYQLDPITLRTLVGTNKIWSNGNGNMTVTYKKKA